MSVTLHRLIKRCFNSHHQFQTIAHFARPFIIYSLCKIILTSPVNESLSGSSLNPINNSNFKSNTWHKGCSGEIHWLCSRRTQCLIINSNDSDGIPL